MKVWWYPGVGHNKEEWIIGQVVENAAETPNRIITVFYLETDTEHEHDPKDWDMKVTAALCDSRIKSVDLDSDDDVPLAKRPKLTTGADN